MAWFELLQEIEPFDELPFDRALVEALEGAAREQPLGVLRFFTPTFRSYASDELKGCGKASFPAFSITGGACALNCDHCQAKILEPMIAATSPAELERKVRDLVLLKDLRGFLLSGGSNRRNEVPYERYYPTIEKLKRDFPYLRIAAHSALLDERRARQMEAAGIDVAMTDVIGAQETIRDVYHLDRPVADFEATLAALTRDLDGGRAAYRDRAALRAPAGRGKRARYRRALSGRRAGAGRGHADLCAGGEAVRDGLDRRRRQSIRCRAQSHPPCARATWLHSSRLAATSWSPMPMRSWPDSTASPIRPKESWRSRAPSAARSSKTTPAAPIALDGLAGRRACAA